MLCVTMPISCDCNKLLQLQCSTLSDVYVNDMSTQIQCLHFTLSILDVVQAKSYTVQPVSVVLQASKSWYGVGPTDGNGSIASDHGETPSQAAATAAEAEAGVEGVAAGVEVMPSMAVSLLQQASDEVHFSFHSHHR